MYIRTKDGELFRTEYIQIVENGASIRFTTNEDKTIQLVMANIQDIQKNNPLA